MKLKDISTMVTRSVGNVKLSCKKNAPQIMLVAGVVGAITATVFACKATVDFNDTVKESRAQIESIRANESISEDERSKAITSCYLKTAVKGASLYTPAIVLGGLSIASIVTSNRILQERNVALATAYMGLENKFKTYRERVMERFGDQVEYEIYNGLKAKEITETVTDENGDEHTVTKTVYEKTGPSCSMYEVLFDERSRLFEKDANYNRMIVEQCETNANIKLRRQGHLFLNEVLDMLDLPRTKAGNFVGWICGDEDCDACGVDFGLGQPRCLEFMKGKERSVWLEFNVQGDILNKMFGEDV